MREERDPVCGMSVDAETAPEAAYHGHKYHFCSDTCRTKFVSHPEQYDVLATASGRDDTTERHEPPRTTSGGFTSPKYGSSTSGGAEFEPGPERHTDERTR